MNALKLPAPGEEFRLYRFFYRLKEIGFPLYFIKHYQSCEVLQGKHGVI